MKRGSLNPAEVEAGLARLAACPSLAGPDAVDAVADLESGARPSPWDLARRQGIPADSRELPTVIAGLAAALVLSRLAVEEIFRLGTSEEAVRLFEERHRPPRKANVVAFRPRGWA